MTVRLRTWLAWSLSVAMLVSPSLAAPGAEQLVELAATRVELETQRSEIAASLTRLDAIHQQRSRTYVRSLRAGLLPLSGGFDALLTHTRQLHRRRRTLVRLLRRRASLAAELTHVEEALQKAEREAPAAARAARAQQALRATEEREAAFRQAFSGSWQPAVVYGAAKPATTSASFAARKGHLGFPVAGRTEVERVDSPTGYGFALRFQTKPGSRARAIHAGRVAFADEYPRLGRTVIVEHGDQYYSVTAQLDAIAVEVGQELSTGSVLGPVGIREGRGEALVEIRRAGEVEEPYAWFGLRTPRRRR